MKHLRSRSDLIETAVRLAPSRAMGRALREGRGENYGGFSKLPPHGRPGWLLHVRSRHGRTWLLAMTVDEIKHSFECAVVTEVPWHLWAGSKNRSPLYAGDSDTRNYWRWVFACEREAYRNDRAEEGRYE